MPPAYLSRLQRRILAWLVAEEQRTRGLIASSHRDLVHALPHDRGNLSHSLQNLEAKGLITINRTPSRRAAAVDLTPAGRQVVVNQKTPIVVNQKKSHDPTGGGHETGEPVVRGMNAARHFVRYRASFLRTQYRGSYVPHPALDAARYCAYPWGLLSPDGRRDPRLTGCVVELWGWVTDIEPPEIQSPVVDLPEEDGGGVLVCDKLAIHQPPLEVYVVLTWSPSDAGDIHGAIMPLRLPLDDSTSGQATTWLNASMQLVRLGRPKGRNPLNTPAGLADAIRQAMVDRMRKGDPVSQEVIAKDLRRSRRWFTDQLVAYRPFGVDWWRLLSEALAQVPDTTSPIRRSPPNRR
jgi:DNA-binding PadR family transcriptional regulator